MCGRFCQLAQGLTHHEPSWGVSCSQLLVSPFEMYGMAIRCELDGGIAVPALPGQSTPTLLPGAGQDCLCCQ